MDNSEYNMSNLIPRPATDLAQLPKLLIKDLTSITDFDKTILLCMTLVTGICIFTSSLGDPVALETNIKEPLVPLFILCLFLLVTFAALTIKKSAEFVHDIKTTYSRSFIVEPYLDIEYFRNNFAIVMKSFVSNKYEIQHLDDPQINFSIEFEFDPKKGQTTIIITPFNNYQSAEQLYDKIYRVIRRKLLNKDADLNISFHTDSEN